MKIILFKQNKKDNNCKMIVPLTVQQKEPHLRLL
jgi:hypothetical protein